MHSIVMPFELIVVHFSQASISKLVVLYLIEVLYQMFNSIRDENKKMRSLNKFFGSKTSCLRSIKMKHPNILDMACVAIPTSHEIAQFGFAGTHCKVFSSGLSIFSFVTQDCHGFLIQAKFKVLENLQEIAV